MPTAAPAVPEVLNCREKLMDGCDMPARRPVLLPIGYSTVKTGTEWAAALVLLILALPLLLVLAVVVRLTSRGPAFYSQMRLGRGGRTFRIHKLRTMTHCCEVATGPVWSIGDDPRVTRVGRWLRDTHLDELPQLWNVLRGEMSLIGPRPERPEIAAQIERAIPEYRGRLHVRPGITGLAQMRLPADTDLHAVQRKLAHDLHYVRRMGPMLDARIAISTVFHFVGMAAWAASRHLVKAFAPPPVEQPPRVHEPLPENVQREIRGFSAIAFKEDFSRAA